MKSIKLLIFIGLSFFISCKTVKLNTNTDETSQFIFDSFSKGSVLMKNNTTQIAILNYNTVTETIVYEENGELFDLVNTDLVDTVYLQNSKFIPVGKVFHEVVEAASLPIFIQHKRKLFAPGKNVGYGQTSELAASYSLSSIEHAGGRNELTIPSNYRIANDNVYWIRKDNKKVSFSNVKQLQRIFPNKGREIAVFMKTENLQLKEKDDLIKIINYCTQEN